MSLGGLLGEAILGEVLFGSIGETSGSPSPVSHLPSRASVDAFGSAATITPDSSLAAVTANGTQAAIDPFETEAEVIN